MPQRNEQDGAVAVGKFIGGLANATFMLFVVLTVTNPWLIGYASLDLAVTFILASVSWFRGQLL